MLTCIYLSFWIVLTLHHSFSPEHDHEQKVCHHGPNEKHFHTDEYAEDSCDLCQYLMAPLEMTTYALPRFPSTLLWADKPGEPYLSYSDYKTVFAQPRAPPSAA
jgi:hypothetical protein